MIIVNNYNMNILQNKLHYSFKRELVLGVPYFKLIYLIIFESIKFLCILETVKC